MMITQCAVHPKYKGVHKPKAKCSLCWLVYACAQIRKLGTILANIEAGAYDDAERMPDWTAKAEKKKNPKETLRGKSHKRLSCSAG